MPTNKLVWILVALLAMGVLVVAFNAYNAPDQKAAGTLSKKADKNSSSKQPLQSVDVVEVTGDTVGETLKDVQLRYETESKKNKDMQDKLLAMEERLKNAERKSGTDKNGDDKVNQVADEVNVIRTAMEEITHQFKTQEERLKTMVPNGYEFSESELGIDGKNSGASKSESIQQTTLLPGYVSVKPLSSDSGSFGVGGIHNKLAKAKGLASSIPESDKNKPGLKPKSIKYDATPFYTIPARATLMEATAMTAIIGAVPVGGRVRDPFPVKIILGDDNLATNGLSIPGLKGVVFEGMATGNWNLSCASVTLTGATFTFMDGRIQHLPNKDKTDFGGEQDGQLEATPFGDSKSLGVEPIGYISNPQGVQCIGGKRITDAPQQLATVMGLGAALTYFESRADAETTTITNADSALSAVTGDDVKFANSRTAAGGVQAALEFYKQRTRDSVDVIYVPPGQKVSLHISRDLYVDYNPNSRKLAYSQGAHNHDYNRLD